MENVSKQYFRVCFCFRRMFRFRRAEAPIDIREVFRDYSENGGAIMSIDSFHKFLKEYQGETNATKDYAQSIFDTLHHHLNIFHRKGLHFEAFFRYLLGDLNLALSPSLGVHHDMKAPLAHYFLYTGHNSYLTGNQFSSDCSVDPIIKALKNGVRVIELDLWPNSTRNDVDVCHGGTLTSPVKLIKCLQAIKNHAFVASEYPVVITFEDHLTPDLQDKVALMVTETFGDMLFCPESVLKELPSPQSLKKKIMISTKPPEEYLESETMQEELDDGDEHKNEAVHNEVLQYRRIAIQDEVPPYTCLIAKLKGRIENWLGVDTSKAKGIGLREQERRLIAQDEDLQNVVPQYRRLIAIDAMKKKGRIDNCLRVDPNKATRLSLSEQELETATATHGTHIVRFTQRNLLRVYPKGMRLDSSNYNPFVGWTHGAQMVAFNMQGYWKDLWKMQGMFRANGGCGYVKKPDILLNAHKIFDPSQTLPIKTTLKVKVYMGEGWHSDFHHTHFDLYSPPDFYTRVGIAGVTADTKMESTEARKDEWEPVWDTEFEFPLTVPELALLRIEVMEYDTTKRHDFGGQTCLPVSELRRGIRSVPLYSRKGEIYKSVKLLMRFSFVCEQPT